ncbi:MAG: T9SS type A sorting domain-containing protein, partial [Brumimicrobium sp.]
DTCDYLSLGEEKLTDLSVYPNPATDVVNISNPTDSESLRIEMLDMNGRVVVSDADALSNTSEATIAIDHLQKGVYTLRIYNEDGQRTFKIVKQ